MKKYFCILLFLPLFLSCNQKKKNTSTFDSTWCLVEMEDRYIGTYLPVEFIETLNSTKSYVQAMKSKPNGDHVIAVEKDVVYANDDYWDQYAYSKEDVATFIFEEDDDQLFLIYDGMKYLRISTSPEYYAEMMPFVLKTIFGEYKTVCTLVYDIEIAHESFEFLPCIGFYEYETMPELFLSDDDNVYSCRIKDGIMELRIMEENSEMTRKETDKIAKVFDLKKPAGQSAVVSNSAAPLINTIYDFPEYEEIRYLINENRNYAYPKSLKEVAHFAEDYNQDVSSSIYIAYYILKNLGHEYVSQELFSEIVECLKTYPYESYDGYYSKIYVAEILQISNIICFSKNPKYFQIDIYDNESKKSIILGINNFLDDYQISYDIIYSDYENESALFPKDFIEAAWYAMWNFQWDDYPTDFVLNDNTAELYSTISEKLKEKTWVEFCNNYESIIFMEDIYENIYSKKPDFLERMIITELVQRCLIAGM